MIKGCVDKVQVPPTTKRPIPTPTHSTRTKTRFTSMSSCKLENLVTSPYFTDFTFFPNITNCEYKKLRFGKSKPNIGVSLICGSHSISVFVKRNDSYVTSNFISHLNFLILNSSSSDYLDKYFEYFDIVFTRHLIASSYPNSIPSIHVENIPLSFSLDRLSNIPSYFHRNIESIRFDFKLKLNVVIKLVIKGCVDSFVPKITSSIAPPIVYNELFKCSNVKDLLPSSSLFKIEFTPYLPNIDINDSRFHKKGITLNSGFYSFSFSLPNNQSLNIIGLGVLLFDGDELRLSEDIFEFTEVSALRLSKSFGRLLLRKLSIPIPDNINFKSLQNVLPFGLTNINKIVFKFVLKRSWKIAFRIQGCRKIESVFLSSTSPLTVYSYSTVPALVNKESFTCMNSINLLRKINKFVTKVKPSLSESEIRKLTSRGSVLPKGFYSIEMSLPHGESLNIIEIGILLHDENQGRYINSMVKVVNLIVSRFSRSFGKVISRNVKLSIPENISVRDLQNLLSQGLTNINKIMLKFYLKKPLKASINIKGCKDSDKVLLTTTLSPTPIVNDESYKCTLVRNVLQDLNVIQMDIIPSISTSELNKLRGVSALPNNGAHLSKALYSMKITPGLGQTLNIIELGIIIESEDENKPMINVIKSIDVEISRLVHSFGKYKKTKRHVFISDDLSIKDLKNILISKLTAITDVYITVELKREVKAQINLKGCSSFDSTTTLLTTLTPVVNDESFTCNENVNIIKLRSIVKLSKVPPLPPIDNIRLRYSSIQSNIGAPIIKGKHEITISLPEGEKGTIIDFGLNFLSENNSTFAWRFIKNITITAYRLRMSFGVLKSSPIKIGLPKDLTVGHLKNILQRPLTEVNKIFIEFVTLKRTYLNIRMNGCFSKKVLKTTTLPPVGCLHLNKYYSHGQIIADKFACDSKICSDGRTLPIILCNKKWTQWKKCSKFCGAGETSRRQICVINLMIRSIDKQNLIKQINETCFNKIEVKPCFEQPCQESCKLTEWSDWSPCNNNTCVDEYQTRLRQLITTNKNTPCTKPLMESQRCIKPQCPCTENAVLHDCANILCPTSCDHMNQLVKCVSNNRNCIKSCVCKFGYLYQNGLCVPRSQCFCLKPDFNKLMLSTTLSATNNQGSTTMSPGGTNQGNSGSNEGSVSLTSNQNSATTTRSSSIGFTVLLKKELQDLNENKQITPPWGPGITNRPFYTATFPWFPGTTPAGVTIKLPSDSTTRIPIKTPPAGLTPNPPDSVTKTSSTLKYYITKPYILPQSNQDANQNQNPSQSPEIREPQMTMLTSPPSVESSNPKQGSNQNSQSPVTDQNGNTRTNINGNNKNTITQFPNFSRQTTIKSYINANSTFIVDCQSCVCTNGRLICSGPQCFAGTNTWSDWSTWSPCTGICGIGIRRRFRQCQGANCKDNSVTKSGLTRFMATNQIQAEDKQCLIKECSCVFSRELFKIHISEPVITKFNIDLKAVWIEKDSIKGLSNSKEIVEPGEIIPSGIVVNAKCTQCTCKNGRFDCVIQCS